MYAYLDRPISALDSGAALLVWSIRAAALAVSQRRCLGATLAPGFRRYGAEGALPHFAMAMTVLVREASEPIEVRTLSCPNVGEHEAVLLALFAATEPGADARVRGALGQLVPDADALGVLHRAFRAVTAELLAAGVAPAGQEGARQQ